jgi:hypothetical protein
MTMLGVYQWPGYNEFKRQVQIKDETSANNPITVAKFARHVGRSVEAFLRVSLLVLIVTCVCTQSYLNYIAAITESGAKSDSNGGI